MRFQGPYHAGRLPGILPCTSRRTVHILARAPVVATACRRILAAEVVAVHAKDELGRYGESFAEQHVRAAGWVVLDRNWRCAAGELDLVAREPDGTIVFIEVKARSGTAFGAPEEAVTWRKARRLRGLAAAWLSAHPGNGGAHLRFDVISVLRPPGEPPRVWHLRAAF